MDANQLSEMLGSCAFTVMVVDDDPDVREIVALGLRATASWRVLVAPSAAAARALLATERPDVVLVDERMPSEGGTAFVASLRSDARFFDIPAISLSARVPHHVPSGMAGAIEKPFDPFALATSIARILSAEGSAPPDAQNGDPSP